MQASRTELAILPNWLGDLVMAVPALRAMGERGTVVAVGAPALLELIEDLQLADATVPYDRHGVDGGALGLWKVARRCGAHRPRRAVIFPPSLRAALLAVLAGCPRRRGQPTDGRRFLLNEAVAVPDPPRSMHQSDVWLAMARGTQVCPGAAQPRLRPGARGEREWKELQGELGSSRAAEKPGAGGNALGPGGFAVLAPGATYGPAKRWPLNHFKELARRIHEVTGLALVVIGGRGEEERAQCATLARAVGALDLSGRTSLPGLAALLAECGLFVGNDSGPAQLAAAMGAPVVTLFGSTSPAWTAPRGERAKVAGPHPVSCTPCFQPTCPIGLPCLEKLDVDEVWREVEELWRQSRAHPSGTMKDGGR